jgi:hypothetical protein
VVESKDETKKKIGRSPDDADALLLTYLEGVSIGPPRLIETPRPRWTPMGGLQQWAAHRGPGMSAGERLRERMRNGHR